MNLEEFEEDHEYSENEMRHKYRVLIELDLLECFPEEAAYYASNFGIVGDGIKSFEILAVKDTLSVDGL